MSQVGSSHLGRGLLNRLSGYRGVYETMAEAWEAARKANPVGHEDPEEVQVHLKLSQSLRTSDYAALCWLLRISEATLQVFDYGGNVGNLYYSYSPYLQPCRNLQWTVYDLPAIVEQGRAISTERGARGLCFTNQATVVGHSDVLLVSGTLHYWEGNIQEFMRQFGERPEHIIVNRSPVHEIQKLFFTVQRTKTCAFACMVRNAGEMISEFSAEGYELVDRWSAPELALALPLFPDWSVTAYSGFYFRLRNQ